MDMVLKLSSLDPQKIFFTGLEFFSTETLETRLYGDRLVYGMRDLFMFFLVSEDTTPMVQFIDSDDNELNNDPYSSMPDLVDDVSDSESEDESERDSDQDTFLKVDSNEYVWSCRVLLWI